MISVRYTMANSYITLRRQSFVPKKPVRLLVTSATRDVLPKVINLYEGIRNGDRHSLAKAITLG